MDYGSDRRCDFSFSLFASDFYERGNNDVRRETVRREASRSFRTLRSKRFNITHISECSGTIAAITGSYFSDWGHSDDTKLKLTSIVSHK